MPAQRLVDRHSLQILKMENAAAGVLPPNNSNQRLVAEDYFDSETPNGNGMMHSISSGDMVDSSDTINGGGSRRKMSKMEKTTVGILCFVNLINYMDRFTIAGILDKIQCSFNIDNSEAGLLQTAFVVSYMVFAPLFGYLGDRYSRKYLMASGVALWSLTTLLGSFMNTFGWFITFRACVGIGEASYSTIAPTIISDMFVDDRRSKMLALFYFAIPVGSGLGYIVGSETSKLFSGAWEWGLRVTPIMGAIAVILIVFVMVDPIRGESENSHLKPTSYKEDVIYLWRNPSFMLSTLGFTCVAFVTGALAWWGPKFITDGLRIQQGGENVSMEDVSFKFGVITMVSGLLGVPLGSVIAQRLRERNSRADPLVCAFGLLMSTPLLFFAAVTAKYNTYVCFTLIFFGELFLNLNCSCDDPCKGGDDDESSVAFIFGGITVASGILGVICGPFVAQLLRKRVERIDPLVCSAGLLISTPFITGAIYFARTNVTLAYILVFFGEFFLNLNWAVVADILLYVVIPTRRSTAEAFQILLSHALGDAGSPYLIGVVSDWLKGVLKPSVEEAMNVRLIGNGTATALNSSMEQLSPFMTVGGPPGCNVTDVSTDPVVDFNSLQYSLFITSFVEVFGGLFFLICAWYIVEDKLKADKAIIGDELMNEGSEPAHIGADEPPPALN